MKEIDFESLKWIIQQNKQKRVMLTFHSIGDTDSVSSAYAMLKYFKKGSIAIPDNITYNSKRILQRLGFKESIITRQFDSEADLIILLDVNNFEDCGAFKSKLENFDGQILIIDHHSPAKISKENVTVFNDESYNSAASIVYELLKGLGVNIDKKLANLIATGIISDSAEFRNAFPKTFTQIGELLEKAKIDYQSLLLEIHHIASIENREGFMYDLFKSNVATIGDFLIIYGQAKVHANKLADDGIKIGADATLFYAKKKDEISFSVRLRPPLDKEYRINLGKLMRKLAPLIEGQGGGHPCAAGAYGPEVSSAQKFIDAFMLELGKHAHK